MIFTVWSDRTGEQVTMSRGKDPPRFVDGSVDPACEVVLHRFKAQSYDEAMVRYHELMGWEPYRPDPGVSPHV